DVVIAEAHPEADMRHIEVLRERMDLVMARQVSGAGADDRKVPFLADLEHLVLGPLAVLPRPDATGELAEVRLRIKVGREVAAMVACIHVDDIDGVERVEIFLRCNRRIGVDHARVEASTEDRRDTRLFDRFTTLPLIVAVPWRGFANLHRIFVDRRVEIGSPSLDTGLEHRHVDERSADIDDDRGFGPLDEGFGCFDVHRVELMNLQYARRFQIAFLMDGSADCLAFGNGARCDMDIAKYIVVLRAFVSHNLGNTASADDKDILFHFAGNTPLSFRDTSDGKNVPTS